MSLFDHILSNSTMAQSQASTASPIQQETVEDRPSASSSDVTMPDLDGGSSMSRSEEPSTTTFSFQAERRDDRPSDDTSVTVRPDVSMPDLEKGVSSEVTSQLAASGFKFGWPAFLHPLGGGSNLDATVDADLLDVDVDQQGEGSRSSMKRNADEPVDEDEDRSTVRLVDGTGGKYVDLKQKMFEQAMVHKHLKDRRSYEFQQMRGGFRRYEQVAKGERDSLIKKLHDKEEHVAKLEAELNLRKEHIQASTRDLEEKHRAKEEELKTLRGTFEAKLKEIQDSGGITVQALEKRQHEELQRMQEESKALQTQLAEMQATKEDTVKALEERQREELQKLQEQSKVLEAKLKDVRADGQNANKALEERQREERRKMQEQSNLLREQNEAIAKQLQEMRDSDDMRKRVEKEVEERRQAEMSNFRREMEVNELTRSPQMYAERYAKEKSRQERMEFEARLASLMASKEKPASTDASTESSTAKEKEVDVGATSSSETSGGRISGGMDVDDIGGASSGASQTTRQDTGATFSDMSNDLRFTVPEIDRRLEKEREKAAEKARERAAAKEKRRLTKNSSRTTGQTSSSSHLPSRSAARTQTSAPEPTPNSPFHCDISEDEDADLEEREKKVAEEEEKREASLKPRKDRKARAPHTKFLSNVFKDWFNADSETAFRWHAPADEREVSTFNDSEGKTGSGPNATGLHFDFNPGPVCTFWNHACAEILLDKTTVEYPKEGRLDRDLYIEMIMDKLKRCKRYYNEARPRRINGVLETTEDVMNRLGIQDEGLKKRVRANQRMQTKLDIRTRGVDKEVDLCSAPGKEKDKKYWKFFQRVLKKLDVQGMSSDETEFDEETKQKFFRVNVLVWRRDISEILQMIDSLRFDSPHFSARGSRGYTKLRDDEYHSRRQPMKRLPRELYDDSWFNEVDERRRSLMLRVSKKDFEWLERQEVKEWWASRSQRSE